MGSENSCTSVICLWTCLFFLSFFAAFTISSTSSLLASNRVYVLFFTVPYFCPYINIRPEAVVSSSVPIPSLFSLAYLTMNSISKLKSNDDQKKPRFEPF